MKKVFNAMNEATRGNKIIAALIGFIGIIAVDSVLLFGYIFGGLYLGILPVSALAILTFGIPIVLLLIMGESRPFFVFGIILGSILFIWVSLYIGTRLYGAP